MASILSVDSHRSKTKSETMFPATKHIIIHSYDLRTHQLITEGKQVLVTSHFVQENKSISGLDPTWRLFCQLIAPGLKAN